MKGSAAMAEVIEPYAEALMALAKDSNCLDQFGEDASGIISVMAESDELSGLMLSPVFETEQKKAVIRQVFEGKIQPNMLNFLLLIVDRKRTAYLTGICKRYSELLRDIKQIVLAEVTSAVELDDGQRQSITEKVKAMTGAQSVEIESQVDSALMGGVIIKVGSQVVDASLRGQLRRIGVNLSRA